MMRDYQVNTLWPLLGSKGVPILRGWDSRTSKTFTKLLSESSAHLRYENLIGDLELIDMISTKHVVTKVSLGEIEKAIDEAEGILLLLENNIQ